MKPNADNLYHLQKIEKELQEVGYKTQVKQLADFFDPYGLESSNGENDDEDEDEEEDVEDDEDDEDDESGSDDGSEEDESESD